MFFFVFDYHKKHEFTQFLHTNLTYIYLQLSSWNTRFFFLIFFHFFFDHENTKNKELSKKAISILIQDENNENKYVRLKKNINWPIQRLAQGLIMSCQEKGDPKNTW